MKFKLLVSSLQQTIYIETELTDKYNNFCNKICDKLEEYNLKCKPDNIRCIVDNLTLNNTNWYFIKQWDSTQIIKGICCVVPIKCSSHI